MNLASLTTREREYFQLFLAGHSGKEIAAQMNINQRTTSCYKTSIRRKLRAENDVELVKIGIRAGLIEL